METKRVADRYQILGWIKNRKDGTVKAVFEGNRKNVTSIIEWCKQGPKLVYVEKIDIEWIDYKSEYHKFEIRY